MLGEKFNWLSHVSEHSRIHGFAQLEEICKKNNVVFLTTTSCHLTTCPAWFLSLKNISWESVYRVKHKAKTSIFSLLKDFSLRHFNVTWFVNINGLKNLWIQSKSVSSILPKVRYWCVEFHIHCNQSKIPLVSLCPILDKCNNWIMKNSTKLHLQNLKEKKDTLQGRVTYRTCFYGSKTF